jgi:ribosomal protein S18 acetylase RimI-like enzyme
MAIEELTHRDLIEAAHIYFVTVNMQNPPGNISLDEAMRQLETNFLLKKYSVFVSRSSIGRMDGITIFEVKKDSDRQGIELFFIGAYPQSSGIGRKLLNSLGEYAKSNNITSINTAVSSIDQRAISFYSSCGFQTVGAKQTYGFTQFEMQFKIDSIHPLESNLEKSSE